MSNLMFLTLGDEYNDHDKMLITTNKTVTEIQDAYKASCRLTGISFNTDDDYTQKNRHWREADKYQIAVQHDSTQLTDETIAVLKGFDCPSQFLEDDLDDKDEFAKLWFWFVKLSLPDLEWASADIPTINRGNLNVTFGYGLYSQD